MEDYKVWVKENRETILDEFRKAKWRDINQADFPDWIEEFAHELFESKGEITIRDRLKSYFKKVKD